MKVRLKDVVIGRNGVKKYLGYIPKDLPPPEIIDGFKVWRKLDLEKFLCEICKRVIQFNPNSFDYDTICKGCWDKEFKKLKITGLAEINKRIRLHNLWVKKKENQTDLEVLCQKK